MTEEHLLCQFNAWVASTNVPIQQISPNTFQIKKPDNTVYPITMDQETVVTPNGATVKLTALGDLDYLKNVVQQVANQAGYQVKLTDRPKAPESRLDGIEDFDLVAFRHRDFRNTPNPTKAKLDSYKSTVDMFVYNTMNIYNGTTRKIGIEESDLRQYVMIWVCNFITHFELPKSGEDNRKLLYAYLKQRFTDFIQQWYRRKNHNVPEVHPKDLGFLPEIPLDDSEEITYTVDDADYKLYSKLLALPHDKLIFVLNETIESEFRDDSTKELAKSILADHKKTCLGCSKT